MYLNPRGDYMPKKETYNSKVLLDVGGKQIIFSISIVNGKLTINPVEKDTLNRIAPKGIKMEVNSWGELSILPKE